MRNQRLDLLGLQFGHRLAAGKAGIGQDRLRQADRVFHRQDGSREGRLIARGGGHVGGQDQLAALGADHRLGIIGLAVFVRLGLAHQL